MAKKSVQARNKKRQKLVAKFAQKRAMLKAKAVDLELPLEQRLEAQQELQLLPRDSSKSRVVNRCRITGRGRGVFRKFGLSRIKLRELALKGHIPGIVKASW